MHRFRRVLVSMWLFSTVSLLAGDCPPGSIELWREVVGGELRIHCKKIDELTPEEIAQLTAPALNGLSEEEAAKLEARRKQLGMMPLVSLSLTVTPEMRDYLQAQLTRLGEQRARAEAELAKFKANRELAVQAAQLNERISQELTLDAIGNAFDILDACLQSAGQGSPALDKLKQALAVSKVALNGVAAAKSETDSERQGYKLMSAVNGMKSFIPAAATGFSPEEWEQIKKCYDTLPDLIVVQERLVKKKITESDWSEIAASLDNLASAAGKFSPRLKGGRAGVQLALIGITKWKIGRDRAEIEAANANVLTAQDYWRNRLERCTYLESFYREQLARSGQP